MIEGRLVRLRAQEQSDAGALQRWMNDPEVAYFTSARYPMSLHAEEDWLAARAKNSYADGVRLAIETKDGRHIGRLALVETRMEDRKAELQITIGEKDCWSQGYGTDAVLTALRFAFACMNLHRVWLTTLEYNHRAVACYRKCGFVEEGRLRQEVFKDGRFWDFIIMGVLRDEFDALYGVVVETEASHA
jgi:RimJ/RimL family protein N-acetyltransferase